MTSETELVINIWETFKDFIPASKRADYAVDLIRHCVEYGFEASDLAAIVDEDDDLTEAYELVFEDEPEEDEIYED